MKSKILLLLTIISFKSFAQDSLAVKKDSLKTTFFSFTPKTKNVGKVNGLTIGAGLNSFLFEGGSIKKVNGLNIEINPLSSLIFLAPKEPDLPEEATYKINGINLSTGNLESSINGLNIIGFYNIGYKTNGITTCLFINYTTYLNGIHFSGMTNSAVRSNGIKVSLLSNYSQKMNGLQFAFSNEAEILKGISVGVFNKSTDFKGIQLGVFNKTNKNKGLQLGFWNINNKRSMPFINW
jgi:hypothetical protein